MTVQVDKTISDERFQKLEAMSENLYQSANKGDWRALVEGQNEYYTEVIHCFDDTKKIRKPEQQVSDLKELLMINADLYKEVQLLRNELDQKLRRQKNIVNEPSRSSIGMRR